MSALKKDFTIIRNSNVDELFGAVGPCPDPINRVHRLYRVNTTISNIRGQLRILIDMARDNGVPAWYCYQLEKLTDSIITVGDIESSNVKNNLYSSENES